MPARVVARSESLTRRWRNVQGGRQEAAAYARKHMLSQQTLEMIADMRAQFATMLVDSKFIVPPAGQKGSRDPRWIDDPQGPHNREAKQTPLVRALLLQLASVPSEVVVTEPRVCR